MDKKKFLDLLKNLQNVMRCPACGALYTVDEMQFMGSQDGYFLLSMTCSKCSLPVWVNFFAGTAQNAPLTDLTVYDLELSQRESIQTNEVIEFHQFLSNFDGDFKKVLKLNNRA